MTANATKRGLTALILTPIIWSAHFLVIYVLNALACARGFGPGWVQWGIVIATLAAAAGLLAVTLPTLPHARRGDEAASPFLNNLALLMNLLIAVALAWNALPALLVPACGSPAAG